MKMEKDDAPISDMGGLSKNQILDYVPKWVRRQDEWMELSGSERALWFWRNVRDGGIPACKRIKQAATLFFKWKKRYEWRPKVVDNVVERISTFHAPEDAKDFGSITVLPWQAAMLAVAYGFVHPKDAGKRAGSRVCEELILLIPRASGKSTLAASISLLECAEPFGKVRSPLILLTAVTEGTADMVYEKCAEILERDLKENKGRFARPFKFKCFKGLVKSNKTNGRIMVKSLGGKNLDGYRTHCAMIDEVSNMKDTAPIETLRSGLGHTRNSMFVLTTTMGDLWNSALEPELDRANRILDGDDDFEGYFPMLFRAENEEREQVGNPRLWEKVNPSLGWTTDTEFYYKRWVSARGDHQETHTFLTRQLCFDSKPVGKFVSPKDIKDVAPPPKTWKRDLADLWTIGIDTADTSDTVGLCIFGHDIKSSRSYAWFKCYAPQSILPGKNMVSRQATKLREWEQAGFLRIHGACIDFQEIANDIEDIYNAVRPVRILGDTHHAMHELITLLPSHIGYLLKKTSKTADAYGEPINFLSHHVARKTLQIQHNPVFFHHLGNVDLIEKPDGSRLPQKRARNDKIDLVDALLMSIKAFISTRDAFIQGDIRNSAPMPEYYRDAAGNMVSRPPMDFRRDIAEPELVEQRSTPVKDLPA